MTKEEVVDLIRDAGFGYLGTIEDNQPRVRPMMPYLNDDGELLLALLSRSRTVSQIKRNPNVEVCFVDRKMCYCRIAATAKIIDDLEKKNILFRNIPMLRQYFSGPEDGNFILVDIAPKCVEAMTPHSREPEIFDVADLKQ